MAFGSFHGSDFFPRSSTIDGVASDNVLLVSDEPTESSLKALRRDAAARGFEITTHNFITFVQCGLLLSALFPVTVSSC